MKSFEQLTKEEFEVLKSSGILKSLYPESPETWEERLRMFPSRPSELEHMDWSSVIAEARSFVDTIEKDGYANEDAPHYLFESVMKTVYGESIWKYINSIER